MRRATPVLVATMLVVSALVAVPAATMAQETQTATAQADENASVAPGAQLAGVVGVQAAEIDGEVETRRFGIRIARADTADAKAAVVASQAEDIEQHLADLRQRKQALDRAHANGSMSESEYRAKVASLHAETRTAARLANQTGTTARTLPDAALERQGVDVAAIRTLSERASELSGPEVAAIAQGIAGPEVGQPARPDAAGERGTDRGNGDRGADARNGTRSGAVGDGGTDVTTAVADVDVEAETGANATDGTAGQRDG